MKKLLTLTFLILFSVSVTRAGGFQINEHGARAMALGGAYAALVGDPSALYYNPAGLTNLSGTQVMFGTTLILPSAGFRGVSPMITEYTVKSQTFTPINFYLTQQLSDDLFVGFGVNNPYGLGTEWEDGWVGEFIALKTEVQTFYFTLAAAYKISDELSVSVGGRYGLGTVLINRNQNLSPFVGKANVDLSGDGNAFGFVAGVLYKPSETFSLGVSFQSETTFDFTGDSKVSGAPSQMNGLLPTGGIEASLTTPMNLTVGAAFQAMKDVTVSADFQYVGWSSYDKLEVTFNDFIDTDTGKPLVNSAARDYENTFILRGGVEYQMSDAFALRGGLLYDKNPVKDEMVDPTLPDADRLGLNIGFGYSLSKSITLDAAYTYFRFAEREITNSSVNYGGDDTISPFNGVYNSSASLIALNFKFNF